MVTPRAELGLVLRALDVLNIRLDASSGQTDHRRSGAVDIDAIVAKAKKAQVMNNELVALLDGKDVGRVRRDARGRLTFVYEDEWRNAADAYPLSLSMPLGGQGARPLRHRSFPMGPLAG